MTYTVPLPQSKINQSARERIGEAIYLLAYLIGAANWETGTVKTTYEKIASETGFPEGTVKRWIAQLSDAGEITVRRVLGGSLIAIVDYEPVARTRRVKHTACTKQSRAGSASPDQKVTAGPSANPDRSFLSSEETAGGPSNRPSVIPEEIKNGLSNININSCKVLSQSTFQNAVQNRFSHSAFGFKTPAECLGYRAPRPAFDYADPWQEKVNAARAKLEEFDETTRQQVVQTVMERMMRDPRPFVSGLIKRGQSGELELRSPHCEQILLVHVLQYLEEERKEAGASRSP